MTMIVDWFNAFSEKSCQMLSEWSQGTMIFCVFIERIREKYTLKRKAKNVEAIILSYRDFIYTKFLLIHQEIDLVEWTIQMSYLPFLYPNKKKKDLFT